MEADELVKQAVAAARAGNEEDSRRLLARALQLDPNNVSAWRAAAQLARSREDTEQALRRVLSLQPGDPWATENLERLEAASHPAAEAPAAPVEPAAPEPEPEPEWEPEPPAAAVEPAEPAAPVDFSSGWSDAPTMAGGGPKLEPEPPAAEEPSDWQDAGGWNEPAAAEPAPPPSMAEPSFESQAPPPAAPPPPVTTPEPPKKRSNALVIVLIVVAVLCLLCAVGGFVAYRMVNRAVEEEINSNGAAGLAEFLEQLEDAQQAQGGNLDFSDLDDYDTTLERNIAIGESDTASLDGLFDAHNWYFEGQAGQDVTIRVDAVGDTDPRIRLIDPSGTVIGEDDDGGGDYNSLLETTLPSTGTYTVRIDVFSTGTYRITIE